MILSNAKIFTGEEIIASGSVEIQDKSIAAVTSKTLDGIDLGGLNLASGFIDLQVYGGENQLFTTSPTPETIAATARQHRLGGTTHFQITYHTGPHEGMLAAIAACQAYAQSGGEGLVGLHLEGPYFNPKKRGAHLAEYIREASIAELETLISAADELPLYLTFAPECCSPEVLDYLLASAIFLSIGHSNATYAEATKAIHAGITRATHLFNAMSPLEGRNPGLVGAIFDAPTPFWASIIADGIHVDYASVRIAKKILGERLFLITDAVSEDIRGAYKFSYNTNNQRFEDKNGILSGSNLTMIQAVANCVNHVGIPLEEALRMASLYPAQAIGQAHRLGKILPDYEASLVAFDDDFRVHGIVQAGRLVWL